MSSLSTEPPTRAITDLLLDLHERSHDLGYRALQRHALAKLGELVPFDAGLLGMGTLRDGVPHGQDVLLHGRPPELMTSWELVKHEDRVALDAFQNPGCTRNHAVAGPIFDGCDAARAHCREWRLAHVLCTAQLAPRVGLYWVMSLYREDEERPFAESERAAIELVVPHVFSAARRARLGQLRGATRVPDAHGQAGAIVDADGLILEADEGLADLLRAEWPRWRGPWLPPELSAQLSAEPSCRLVLGTIAVRSDTADGLRLVHLRRAILADRLTAREREIAEAFSLGETYREIGARLAIAPNTVRRHLANIYAKLGISSKVELDRMLGRS